VIIKERLGEGGRYNSHIYKRRTFASVESPRSHSGVEKDLCSSAWITKDDDSRGPRTIEFTQIAKEDLC
jgi:hypothetical protein